MGNLETMPPTPGRPHGTVVFGGDPSPEIVGFFRAQTAQPVSIVDTTWLSVGHVDEFVQFLPVSDGWKAIVADPRAGLDLLRKVRAAGQGGEKLHGNLPTLEWPYDERIDQRDVDEFLRDQQFVDTNRTAAERIDKNLRTLGLDPSRVVRVPMLFTARSLDWAIAKSAADQLPPGPQHDKAVADLDAMRQGVGEIPNLVNGLVVGPGRYVAPKPYGPLLGGKDLFALALDQSLGKLGYHVTYVDDLTSAHVSEGEIHCSTNTFRSYSF
jgi:protein-arginine deiminase